MKNYCGANCETCDFRTDCKGCEATCGSPFGGTCIAAEYVKIGGLEAYQTFKRGLLDEINDQLVSLSIPKTDILYELSGAFVNLTYPLPNGENVKFLKDQNIYLGCQIESPGSDFCYGVVADSTFILICSYYMNGSEPELIRYQKR